jgi:putative nucleotidyltransferase with HDIG domain
MIELVDNPKTSAASLARLICADQALTARILKLANSAYYGFPREISTVNQAIVVLGFNAVKDTGLSLSVFDMFKDGPSTSGFDITRFWEHSMAAGIGARLCARRTAPGLVGEGFVAGLLHDIGKVVFRQYFPREFGQILDLVTQGCSLDDAEMQILGCSHAQVGAWLVEKWRLPAKIVEAIAYHHIPAQAPSEPAFVAAITLANYLVHRHNLGASGRVGSQEAPAQLWEILGTLPTPFEQSDIEALESDFLLQYDQADSFVSFIHDEAS